MGILFIGLGLIALGLVALAVVVVNPPKLVGPNSRLPTKETIVVVKGK